MTGELRSRGITVLLTWEMRDIFGSEITAPAPDLSSIVDNLMLLRFAELDARLHRVLSIVKVRDSDHDPTLQALHLGPCGISLGRVFDGASGVLSGTAIPQGDR